MVQGVHQGLHRLSLLLQLDGVDCWGAHQRASSHHTLTHAPGPELLRQGGDWLLVAAMNSALAEVQLQTDAGQSILRVELTPDRGGPSRPSRQC